MNNVYLDNVKRGIKRQIIWANSDGRITDPQEFLDEIIAYCTKLKDNPPKKKEPKTRHGSGRKKREDEK